MKKFVYFPRGPQNETVSNLLGDVLSRSFNVIGQLMKKCCFLLFSISIAIGQFSSKWPGSSSCTVMDGGFSALVQPLQLLSNLLTSPKIKPQCVTLAGNGATSPGLPILTLGAIPVLVNGLKTGVSPRVVDFWCYLTVFHAIQYRAIF